MSPAPPSRPSDDGSFVTPVVMPPGRGKSTRNARVFVDVVIEQPRLLILASAGSGKTFQLTNRYLMLLRTGALDRILATTFTRKAAGEIFERVLLRLAAAASDAGALALLQKFVGLPPITRDECLGLLRHLTQNLHRARIGTLDAVFAQMAGSHSLELGMPPGWRLIESLEGVRLMDQAIDTVLRQSGREEAHRLMHMLSKGQTSRRVHELIRDTVRNFTQPYQMTQESAWMQLASGAGRKLSDLELEAAIAVLESRREIVRTKQEVNKNYASAIAKNLEQLTSRAWDLFLKDGIPAKLLLHETQYYRREIPPELIEAFRPLMEHARAMVTEVWANQTHGTWQTLDRVHRVLNELKAREGMLAFDDIPRLLSQRLAQQSVASVGYRLDGHFDHLLLDEFQDTSLAQWNVLQPFAEETIQIPGKTFFCVGDGKQAIYSFRGGKAAIFDTLQSQLPGVETMSLDESRRSSPAVIEAVNQTFASLAGCDDFETLSRAISDWCHAVPRHTTARSELPGYVCLEVAESPPLNEDVAKPTKDDHSEQVLALAAQRIADLARDCPAASVGVLFRSNDRIRGLAHELRQREIKFSEEGGSLVLDSAAVQLLLSVLRIADHPGDRVARYHVAHSPLADQLQLTTWDDDAAAIMLSVHVRRKLLSDGYVATLQRWVMTLAPSVEPRDRERMRQLLELAERHLPSTRPRDFIRWVENERVENRSTSRIQLMTIHKSKGLEFDIVILPDLDTDLIQTPDYLTASPSPAEPPDRVLVYRTKGLHPLLPPELQQAYEQTEASQVVDSLCLLYVAMTRAVHALHLIVPVARTKGTPKSYVGLLLTGLGRRQSATARSILYETGEARWFDRCPELQQRPDEVAVQVEPGLPRIQFAPLTGGRRRGMGRVVPSQLSGKSTLVRISTVLKLDEPSGGIDRGTLFHAWFERVGWLDESRPSEDELRQVGVALGAEQLNLDRCLSQFQALLRQPAVALALSRQNYQPPRGLFSPAVLQELAAGPCDLDLDRERRFAVGDAGQLLSGMIDRLVLIRRHGQVLAADLLDFKTDALPGDETLAVQEKVSAYRDQMRSYARAIARIYKLSADRISTRLVMLATGRVEIVKDDP